MRLLVGNQSNRKTTELAEKEGVVARQKVVGMCPLLFYLHNPNNNTLKKHITTFIFCEINGCSVYCYLTL